MLFRCVALLLGASPSRGIAFQSRRPSGRGPAFPSPCYALLRRCPANHSPAFPSPCCAVQSNALAARISPSPLHTAALLRRRVALLCVAVPSPFAAPHGRATQCLCASVRCRSFAGPFIALLLPRRSSHRVATPSPWRRIALLFLRRSRLSRAFPSPCRANQSSSFAALGLAGLLRRRAARRCAIPLRRLPEQIRALPLPPLRFASPSLFRCNALHRSSIARPRRAVLLLRQAHHRKASPSLFRANQGVSFATPIPATPLHVRARPR